MTEYEASSSASVRSYGPSLPLAKELHAQKYRTGGESFKEAMTRVASALQDSPEHYHSFRNILLEQKFLPAGRVQASVGAPREVTPYNCLSGKTKVLTREYGLVPIESLAGKEVYLLDGNRQWVKSPIYSFGIQKTYSTTFTNGRKTKVIRSTGDHDWVYKGVKTPTLSSKYVDFIFTKPNQLVDSYFDGVRHGFIYGDGSKTSDGLGFQYRVCSDHHDILPYFEGVPRSYPPSCNGDPVLYFFGKFVSTDFKKLPKNTDDPSYLLGFIRGWLAADGCVSTTSEVTICGDRLEEEWLTTYGPIAGFYITGSSLLASKTNLGTRKKISRNIRFDLRSIFPEDLLITRKASRLQTLSEKRNPRWRVKSIEEYSDEVVYCAVVPSTHSFVLEGGLHSGNCFVSGTIQDSMDDIMDKAKEAAFTMRLGGGIGYDFSTLRPRGDRIKTLDSQSSGPISFMDIFDAVCSTVSSSGHRRGAQMGVLRVDHPDIEEFIRTKQNSNHLTNFNISVGITDKFMEALKNDTFFDLVFEGRVYERVRARSLWDSLMRATWDWAEPGVLFIDTMNKKNNLWYCETISATNPCGEQPLPPYGACLLGSFNLTKYVVWSEGCPYFDRGLFEADIPVVVRAMDNIIDYATYPLPEQEKEAKNKRRMGLGLTGVANTIEYVWDAEYGSVVFLEALQEILRTLRDGAYKASIELAKEKGAFPLYDTRYLEGEFILSLPEAIRDSIKAHGIRNSHLLSIAPTGTISLTADNVSSGIEPVFTHQYTREIRSFDGTRDEVVSDYAYREWEYRGRTADQISPEEHVKVLTLASQYVDSACSKTCNIGDGVTWEEFKNVYIQAYEGGASGCTTFRSAGKRYGILNSIPTGEEEDSAVVGELSLPELESSEGAACFFDPATGRRTCE